MTRPSILFCFGLGYSARRLGAALLEAGWRVRGTCRTADKRRAMQAAGYEAFLFDRDRPLDEPGRAFAGVTHVLSSVPPDPDGDPGLRRHGADLATLEGLRWVGYLSTTGVYGDRGGGWVDEDSELRPTGPRGERRVAAEAGWRDLWRRHGLPVHIFRLAGIYGPGRSALDAVREGRARRVVKPGQVFSRIHVEDIADVLRASMARPRPGAIYNLCDDAPTPPQDVVLYACTLLGIEPPPEVAYDEAELSEMARGFYADNKRVSNRRIKEEMGVRLRYPDYQKGLKGLLEAERAN